jgi:hypothetical protein
VIVVLKSAAKTETTPLYVLNDVIISAEEFKNIEPSNIKSVNVLKDKMQPTSMG